MRSALDADQIAVLGKALANDVIDDVRVGDASFDTLIIDKPYEFKRIDVPIRELDDAPFLTDFGLARRLAGDTVTNTGEVMGTPEFMSPEQIDNARSLLPVSDVYSLGVILYVILTGKTPYPGSDRKAVLEQVRKQLEKIVTVVIFDGNYDSIPV